MTATTSRPPVSVEELKRAWQAIEAGAFLDQPQHSPAGDPPPTSTGGEVRWAPAAGERVLPVIGATGSCGATTVALGLALASTTSARVVECSSVTASALASATTAELGLHESGWRQGLREDRLLERASTVLPSSAAVPAPTPAEKPDLLTVLDCGWEAGHLLSTPGWLAATLRASEHVVVATTATVPGLRRLEGVLHLLGPGQAVAAVLGPRRKKWPRGVEHSAGPQTRALFAAERVVEIPTDRSLAVTGLNAAPLPASVLTATARLLERTSNSLT